MDTEGVGCKDCKQHSGIVKWIKAIEKEVALRFDSLEKTTHRTKEDLDRRLETMNEFRAQLDKQARTFIAKSEVEILMKGQNEKIEQQRKEMAGMKNWLIGLLVAVIINLVGVILLLLRS